MTISTTPTGKELMAHIDTLIGDRWVSPTTWKRNEYTGYQVISLPFAVWVMKNAAPRWKNVGPCGKWADLGRSAFIVWAAEVALNPIAMGSISALHVGFHHPPEAEPGLGHRLNWTLNADGSLWFLDASYYTNPNQDRWVYRLDSERPAMYGDDTEWSFDGFFALYA